MNVSITKKERQKKNATRSFSRLLFVAAFFSSQLLLAQSPRQSISLNENWKTFASNQPVEWNAAQLSGTNTSWETVNVPHNWDAYDGYRRLLHGNRHGDAWYKKTFTITQAKAGKRFFLFFEGVSSYASVYLNGVLAGTHAGGRTTFTIDITDLVKTNGKANDLQVRASHPANIKDLPWVCGGCSDERGFSEGSQPMGIFRPVHLVVTNDVRVQPFGVHAWADIKNDNAVLSSTVTIKNYSRDSRHLQVRNELVDAEGKSVAKSMVEQELLGGDSLSIDCKKIHVHKPHLWSNEDPYLYRIVTSLIEKNKVIDQVQTEFGFRTINWKTPTHQFFLNNKPVFINGIAGYEHLLGQSHAFSDEQIATRIKWLKAAGFNAFRDAHQPHNLLYGQLCDRKGILWWTQLSAHIWYDSPAFRANFKQLLREWVIERRNDPSVILWGLQNESKLPEDFAKECTQLIRDLDPTASVERLVTTCNGGTGTDWDVPQNWTGTYGGDPLTYASDIKKQVLIGEYGAWRTIDLHTEGPFVQNGPLSEDRMVQLMETKVRLAESVKDSSAGQFFWLMTSHDNPGRVQGGEGRRELDRIGPVNYKGMLTSWEEPTDAFYMFRANYASKISSPMVYIVSHTWPGRWTTTGKKDNITVYSNCDEVELFNDLGKISLGRKKNPGRGEHFRWDQVPIQYNVLYAAGYVNGRRVAQDTIVLDHLPKAPSLKNVNGNDEILRPAKGYQYIYRVNCGGGKYMDHWNNSWQADVALHGDIKKYRGSLSWANQFENIPDFFASQRRTRAIIRNTTDARLFQDFRYGKSKLQYSFPLPDGEYLVELFFAEPWLNIGGGMNAAGMRLFDVAFNGHTVINDLDIWSEAGTNTALKKTVRATVRGGRLVISFPESKSGEAMIAAIAIASTKKKIMAAPAMPAVTVQDKQAEIISWIDEGDAQYSDDSIAFRQLASNLFGNSYLRLATKTSLATVNLSFNAAVDIYVGVKDGQAALPAWLKDYENAKTEVETDENGSTHYRLYRKRFKGMSTASFGDTVALSQYPLFIVPVNDMQPAYDLKPVTSYRANVSILAPGVQKENFNSREAAVVKVNIATSIAFPVQTGVADIYSVTVKYFYGKEDPVRATVQLLGPGNVLMMEEAVSFTYTRPGKTNSFTFNSKSMINAGNYTVKLLLQNAEGLIVTGVDIQ